MGAMEDTVAIRDDFCISKTLDTVSTPTTVEKKYPATVVLA